MAKKSNEKWIFLAVGAVGAFLLHGQISGIVDKLKGGMSSGRARSYYGYGIPSSQAYRARYR